MNGLLRKLFQRADQAYWLEITTEQPTCTYFFGPYSNQAEAIAAQAGFVEDLTNEGAQNIEIVGIKRRRTPPALTIDESES